jgi:hypothetical protein
LFVFKWRKSTAILCKLKGRAVKLAYLKVQINALSMHFKQLPK